MKIMKKTIARNRIRVAAALLGLVFLVGLGYATSAVTMPDPERDAVVAKALVVATERGELSARLVSAEKGDAAAARQAGSDVGVTVSGQIWTVTLSGTFDAAQVAPGADPASGKGRYHKLVLYFRDGSIVGGAAYP
jgi:hypothetical protein